MKKYQKFYLWTFVPLLFLFQGCYTMNQIGTYTEESIEITNKNNTSTINHFSRTKTINHFIYGLVSPDDVGIEEIVSEAVKMDNGTAAVNVKMKYQQTFLNGFVGILTFGIYTPFTLTVDGDVIKQ